MAGRQHKHMPAIEFIVDHIGLDFGRLVWEPVFNLNLHSSDVERPHMISYGIHEGFHARRRVKVALEVVFEADPLAVVSRYRKPMENRIWFSRCRVKVLYQVL